MKKPALTKKNSFGFTLIELVVVLGVLAVLFTITLVALNPARQFMQARDTQRGSDVKAILDAVGQFYIDNGQLPGDGIGLGGTNLITTTDREISSSEANICAFIVTRYLAALPTDPSSIHEGKPLSPCPGGNYNTEYTIRRTSGNRVMVTAPNTEMTPSDPIQITR
jgi:prepilin-type N-terminal cleavage/methylation domain-containing protein